MAESDNLELDKLKLEESDELVSADDGGVLLNSKPGKIRASPEIASSITSSSSPLSINNDPTPLSPPSSRTRSKWRQGRNTHSSLPEEDEDTSTDKYALLGSRQSWRRQSSQATTKIVTDKDVQSPWRRSSSIADQNRSFASDAQAPTPNMRSASPRSNGSLRSTIDLPTRPKQAPSRNQPQSRPFSTQTPSLRNTPRNTKFQEEKRGPQYLQPRGKEPLIHLPAPEPTQAYLEQARVPPTRLPISQRQRLLLVLDLNGTLVKRGKTKKFKRRPHLSEFLKYCFENHAVLVWSSARPHNVNGVCAEIFDQEQMGDLMGLWARDTLGLSEAAYSQRVQVYKNLDQVWSKITDPSPTGRSVPEMNGREWLQGKWGQHNTVLIDDSSLKAAAQPHNLLLVPEYTGEDDSKDVSTVNGVKQYALAWMIDQLEAASRYADVSAFGAGLKHGRTLPVAGGGAVWSWDSPLEQK